MTQLEFTVDPQHGARITSLRGPDGHEWLWRRDAPQRDQVRPGDVFVDAGGLEECFPTVSGQPDHGDVWSQPWQPDGAGLSVGGPWYHLHRTLAARSDTLTATYRLEAEPGRWFIWAAHALLELSLDAHIDAPDGLPIEVDAGDGLLDAA